MTLYFYVFVSFNEFIKSIKKNKNKKIGIMFGPEASGLSNEDIVYCNYGELGSTFDCNCDCVNGEDWAEHLQDEEFKEYCYNMICDKVILKYEKNFGIDDVVVEEEISE